MLRPDPFIPSFFIDYKKHQWKREEKIQELFIIEKMNIYKELINLLTELKYSIPLVQLGEEILRFPKDKRISPEIVMGTVVLAQ